jgi:folate-binding protein YgfZ
MKAEVGSWVQTILTNEKGRMIDILWVYRIREDFLYIATGLPALGRTKEWIEKFIIMEDVRVSHTEHVYVHLVIVGDFDVPLDEALMQFVEEWRGVKVRHILVRETSHQSVFRTLEKNAVQRRSPEEFEDYRVSEGIPHVGTEITDEFNPLEAGLGHLINWNKGCYVGQEVIARLDTYKKVQRRLVRLELSSSVAALPARIVGPLGDVGTITSITTGAPYRGLGYVGARHVDVREETFVVEGYDNIQVKLKD